MPGSVIRPPDHVSGTVTGNVGVAWASRRHQVPCTPTVGCHTWRATGITIYLENDGRLEHAQQRRRNPRTYADVCDDQPLYGMVYRKDVWEPKSYASTVFDWCCRPKI
jgi:hypothetical protein